MDVIGLSITGQQGAPHRLTDLGEVDLEPINSLFVKDRPAIFCDEHEVTDQS